MPNFIGKFSDSPYPYTPIGIFTYFLMFIVMYKYLC